MSLVNGLSTVGLRNEGSAKVRPAARGLGGRLTAGRRERQQSASALLKPPEKLKRSHHVICNQ